MRAKGAVIGGIIGVVALGLTIASFVNVSAQQTTLVPSWVKSISGWWSEGKISDEEYLNATQFLVNSGIIKIPLIIDLQNQIASLKSQLNTANLEITSLRNQTTSSSSASNPSQSIPTSANSASLDPKIITEEWLHGNITDMQFIAQIQALINSGKIAPYTKPSTFLISVTKPIPTNERELAESALNSRGIDTSGHSTGGVDVIFLIGFLQYLCNEGYASGDICFLIPGPIHIQNTTTIDALNNNATINAIKTTLQQWLDNKTSDQDLVNQLVALVNNGTNANPAQDFKEIKTPTQPISSFVRADWGSWASGQADDNEWRNGALAQLYHLGYLHNP